MPGEIANRPVFKYTGYFALTYYLAFVLIAVVLSRMAVSMTGLFYAIVIFGSGRVPAYCFLKEHGRLYTQTEKRNLIIGTFASTLRYLRVFIAHL